MSLHLKKQDFSTWISETSGNVCFHFMIGFLWSFYSNQNVHIQCFFDVVRNKLQTVNIGVRKIPPSESRSVNSLLVHSHRVNFHPENFHSFKLSPGEFSPREFPPSECPLAKSIFVVIWMSYHLHCVQILTCDSTVTSWRFYWH